MFNLYFPICSFFVALLLCIDFFSKERVKNKETKIFAAMITSSLIDTILMILVILIGYGVFGTNELAIILNKLDFIQYILWAWSFFLYIFYISFNNKKYIKNITQ